MSRESLAFRLERLEQGAPAAARPATVAVAAAPAPEAGSGTAPERAPTVSAAPHEQPPLGIEQIQEAWRRSVLPAVEQRSIPFGKALGEGHPIALDGEALTIEFPEQATFHLRLAEDPKNTTVLRDALYEITGVRLAPRFVIGKRGNGNAAAPVEEIAGEDDLIELMKSTFDARELEE
jgi:hypothetical protein